MKQLLIIFLFGLAVPAQGESCDLKTTPIAQIQGSAETSALEGQEVWVKGVVTGDFQGQERLGGYFIQSQQPDASKRTSEGLFIQDSAQQLNIQIGDLVLIKGQVSEQFEVTQVKPVSKTVICASSLPLPAPFKLRLPLGGFNLEQIEGMRVTLAEPAVITDLYQYLKFGEMTVSSALLMSPTASFRPGKKAKKQLKKNRDDQLQIDDGRLSQFAHPFAPGADGHAAITAVNALRLGQRVKVTGILHYAFGKYKLQPTTALSVSDQFFPRSQTPADPGGAVKVATFNIENFFTSIDHGEESCGPLKNFGCRGADSEQEYQRQLAKLVNVLNSANAAVVGLQELENNDKQSIEALVNGLNVAAKHKKWAYIDTGALGDDAIKVGLIYQPNQVKPVGAYALLNQKADPEFLENRNRIIVAQTFSTNQGDKFNLATVHFKSKSCRDAEGLDKNQGDGQGCYNPIRVQVAQQVSRWLKSDPTGEQVAATLLVGDFNSYQKEDPIHSLAQNGYHNVAESFIGPENWTTSYRGTVGSLDYVLVNQAAKKLVTGVTQWHLNSVEISQFGYDLEPLDKNVSRPADFYSQQAYASSDHDLVIVGLNF